MGTYSPIKSWAIVSDIINREPVFNCDKCHSTNKYRYDLLIQGFDDFRDIDYCMKGFIGSCCPLISTLENIDRAVNTLTGVSAIKVGYSEWNQEGKIPKNKRFMTEPKLSALFVDAILKDIVGVNRKPIEICSECGHKKANMVTNSSDEQCTFPVFESWNGEDMFTISTLGQFTGTIITETGVEKLKELGMMDLVLEEIEWA